MKILEWIHGLPADVDENKSNQQVDISAAKHVKEGSPLFGWRAMNRPLDIPADKLSSAPSTRTSIKVFVRGVGIGLPFAKNLIIKKLRETCELELEQEETEPTIGIILKIKFELPNEHSENIVITDSDFILSDRTNAICITADMRFNTRLEADFKSVVFLFNQRLGLGGLAVVPPSVSQVPGKATRVSERNVVDPGHVVLALTQLSEFLVERG